MGIFEKQDKMVEKREAKKQQERDTELRQFANAVTEEVFGTEVFESGATRNAVDYRYDLLSIEIMLDVLDEQPKARELCLALYQYYRRSVSALLAPLLADTLKVSPFDLVHLYAQAMHEGASKYGEGNWLKGIPESNLLNHALHHLFKFVAGNTSEDHRSHLVWNVFTLIHFRLVAEQTKS